MSYRLLCNDEGEWSVVEWSETETKIIISPVKTSRGTMEEQKALYDQVAKDIQVHKVVVIE